VQVPRAGDQSGEQPWPLRSPKDGPKYRNAGLKRVVNKKTLTLPRLTRKMQRGKVTEGDAARSRSEARVSSQGEPRRWSRVGAEFVR
jgi:hypothetical protein